MKSRFRVPQGDKRYAEVDYWNYGEKRGRHFTWRFQVQEIAFF